MNYNDVFSSKLMSITYSFVCLIIRTNTWYLPQKSHISIKFHIRLGFWGWGFFGGGGGGGW